MQIGLKTITKILEKRAPETLIGVISCGLVTTSVYELVKATVNGYKKSKDKEERVIADSTLKQDLLNEKEVTRQLRVDLKMEKKERLIQEHKNSDLENEIKSIREDSQVANSGLEEKSQVANSGLGEKSQVANSGLEEKSQVANSGLEEKSQVANSGLEEKLEGDEIDLSLVVTNPNPINVFDKWVKDQRSSMPEEYISVPKRIVLPVKPMGDSKLGLDELMCLSPYVESNVIAIKLIILLFGWYASFYPLVNYKLKIFFFGKEW
jgi:hypothetical protein